ncbi:MAG: DUF429 domain-containing protein [Dehalococcoidia bacterium]
MTRLAGMDGCRGGWVVASSDAAFFNLQVTVVHRLGDIDDALPSRPDVIAVDIPIGLVDTGRRTADLEARRLLSPHRISSVFPAPLRPVIDHMTESGLVAYSDHAAVSEWSRGQAGAGISIQAWGIYPKVMEVDVYMRATRDSRVHEVHPEVCFSAMTENVPMPHPKRTAQGQADRAGLLSEHLGLDLSAIARPRGANSDDLYDALAALWTARRIADRTAKRVPVIFETDSHGLDMAIWY